MEFLDKRRTLLVLLALFTGGAVPIQLVTLSFGYAQLLQKVPLGPKMILVAHEFARHYVLLAYLPALVILTGIILYSRSNYPDLFRRIVIGMGVGVLATVALDVFRQMGVINGWLPGDSPAMFGKAVTGSRSFAVYYPTGYFVHYLNGANFGLIYTFVWGKQASYRHSLTRAIGWLLIVELGMMTGPPMAPIVGPFGTNYAWPQFFLLTLSAHLAFGTVLGILAQFYLKPADRGGLWQFIKGRAADSVLEPAAAEH